MTKPHPVEFTPTYAVYTFAKAFAALVADLGPRLDLTLYETKRDGLQRLEVSATWSRRSVERAAHRLAKQCRDAGIVRFGQLPVSDPLQPAPFVERLRAPKHGIAVRLWSRGKLDLHFQIVGATS